MTEAQALQIAHVANYLTHLIEDESYEVYQDSLLTAFEALYALLLVAKGRAWLAEYLGQDT
jgi:hypothetical protein